MSVRVSAFYLVLVLAAVSVHAASQTPSANPGKESPRPQLSHTEIAALQVKADTGDASSQFELGKAYEVGNGVPQNDDIAVKWYRKAADQGNADAQNALGVMYRLGTGVSRDKEEAVRWYHRAAKLGNSQAIFNLGVS